MAFSVVTLLLSGVAQGGDSCVTSIDDGQNCLVDSVTPVQDDIAEIPAAYGFDFVWVEQHPPWKQYNPITF